MCPLPLLFVLVIDYALQDCSGFGIQICDNKQFADLDLADNITLIEANKRKAPETFRCHTRETKSFGNEN